MRKFRRTAAVALAATMVLGSAVTVFGADDPNTKTAEGNGDYEGYVEQTSVFSVEVPTAAANQFDFFVDPNGLLATTNYARLSGSAADFESGATLFFTRTPSDTVRKYGKDSTGITMTNMSSYAVNVEVSATISGTTGIKLAESAPADTVTDPTLYLAIVSGTETKPITASGAKYTGTIAGEPNNFEIQYNSTKSEYEYVQKTATTESPLAAWKTASFNLTGACGGTWTDAQAAAAPKVSVTWKVTDPNATPAAAAPSIAKTEYTKEELSGESGLATFTINYGSGDKAGTAITSVVFSADNGETFKEFSTANAPVIDNDNKNFGINKTYFANMNAKRIIRAYFDNSETKYVEITVTP